VQLTGSCHPVGQLRLQRHGQRQFRKFEPFGRLHNCAGSAGRRGGSPTADLSTRSRVLTLAIALRAARIGIPQRAAP